MPEKRKYRRLPLKPLPCRISQDCHLINLSICGAFVASARPLPRRSAVTLEVTLPGGRTVRARARVERAGDYFEGIGKPLLGMGLSFIEIESADRIAIAGYLREVYELTRDVRRVETRLDARVRTGEHWTSGLVREAGERSLFVATAAVAPIGSEVDVLLRLPNARVPVGASGVVIEVTSPAGEAREAENPGEADGAGEATGEGIVPVRPPSEERGLRIELREVDLKARELLNVFLAEARE